MAPRRLGNNVVELLLIHSYQVKPKKTSIVTEISKEMTFRKTMLLDDITSFEEHVYDNGSIACDRCVIYDKPSGNFFQVMHTYQEIHEAKYGDKSKIGYGTNIPG